MINYPMNRRTFLLAGMGMAAGVTLGAGRASGQSRVPILRRIPSSGEDLPVIGLGTSGTFDVGSAPAERADLAEVLKAFSENGGKLIDSSPMYGRAEAVVGDLLGAMAPRPPVFAATKVWTDGKQAGIEQMQASMKRMGVKVIDLMQIHNLRDWKTHLSTLRAWKQEGRIRYIGITTSHGRSHPEMEELMRTEPLDFVQFSYSLDEREAEKRLLPLAAERGIATLINRPFARGDMFRKTKGKPLPDWSGEFDCRSWAQFFLKFILAHPAVTCAIPATSKASHLTDNMGAGFGRLPDQTLRLRMLKHYESL
jgi:aryl-alcohol dehydrogenase-like predicted oxidoreductase